MHTIRLRGPWEFRVLEDHARPDVSDAELPSGRIKMPTGWGASLGRDFRGRVCYTRRFNQPTGLDDAAQVRLCVGAVDGLATISLNDELLGQMRGDQTKQWFDVKPLLRPANQLEITVEFPVNLDPTLRPAGRDNAATGLIGEVWLEIVER